MDIRESQHSSCKKERGCSGESIHRHPFPQARQEQGTAHCTQTETSQQGAMEILSVKEIDPTTTLDGFTQL